MGAPIPFLFGPLIYLYAIALTRPLDRVDPRWLGHALPFVGDVLYMAQAFYLKGGAEKVALAQASAIGQVPTSFHVVEVLEVVQALVYLFLTWQALERYGRKMHGYFSDLTRVDLWWLKTLVFVQVAVWCVVGLAAVLRWAGNGSNALSGVVQLGSALMIFLTGYVSLWQPELAQKATAARLAEEPAAPSPAVASEPAMTDTPAAVAGVVDERPSDPVADVPPEPALPPAQKYQRNRLDDAEARELLTKLEALMGERHLYRESGLTLPTLAEALGVTPHMLSQLLNVRVGKSFFVFVNAHRADALKEALADPSRSDRGVLDLAFEVGFSSKSTLNTFFKKHTGMTPTEFRGHANATKNVAKSGA